MKGDKIISEAKADAENIKITASLNAKEILNDAQKKKEETLKSIEEILRTVSSECTKEYTDIISETSTKFQSISDSVRTKAESMLAELEKKAANIKGE